MQSVIQKVIMTVLLLPLMATDAGAQKSKPKAAGEIRIPMEPAYWQYDTAGLDFVNVDGVQAAHSKNGSALVLKDRQFSVGTIEYDIALGQGFLGIYFRMSADGKNGENFYLRYFRTAAPENRTALQYCAVIDGVSIWDLSDEYQAGAALKVPGWNHIKLVVSDHQLKVYVNDMSRPALSVPKLEGDNRSGGIYFMGGDAKIANLVLRPGVLENIDNAAGYLADENDTRYLRHWQVSDARELAFGKDVVLPVTGAGKIKTSLPDSGAAWKPLTAESRGLVNLTRIFGRDPNSGRRLAWLKTTLNSDTEQERLLHLGFSDEIWLMVNGQVVYTDKNYFGSPGQKFPKGRCTIENATVKLPLRKGENEILIGLASFFYGWGIIARLDDTEGIHLPDRK